MDIYYNNQKVSSLQFDPKLTVGNLKEIISNWLLPQGVINYNIRLKFNEGTELASIVFDSNQYDNINFISHANILSGSKLYIINLNNLNDAKTGNVGRKFDEMPNDILVTVALNLNYNEIMNLCNTSKKFNTVVCNNKNFWISKIIQDFKINPINILIDPRKQYKNLIKPKYYILVDTHYERSGAIYKDITNQLPIVEVSGTERKVIVEDLVSIGGKSTKPQYNEIVNKLYSVVRKHKFISGMFFGDNTVYNPIFKTDNIKKKTIKEIINLAREMDYCEIWGNSRNITEYEVEPGVKLIHLELEDTEAG